VPTVHRTTVHNHPYQLEFSLCFQAVLQCDFQILFYVIVQLFGTSSKQQFESLEMDDQNVRILDDVFVDASPRPFGALLAFVQIFFVQLDTPEVVFQATVEPRESGR